MELEELQKLGFNKNEAIVFMTLIQFSEADAHQLIAKTKFHKNIVYDNLSKLIDKGLVSFITKDKKRVYKFSSPHSLLDYIEEQQRILTKNKKIAEKLSREIEAHKKKIIHESDASIFKGIKAVKSFYQDTLKHGDYVSYGAPEASVNIMGETFWKNYNLKRKYHNVKAKMIFNPSIRQYGKTLVNGYTKIRYFEKDFEPLTETHIQKNYVAIIIWKEEPLIFIIEDKETSDDYKEYFEKMWKTAKP